MLNSKKKKRLSAQRHRTRRTRDIRQKVARTLERALVEAPKIPLIHHLFTSTDSMGTPRASLKQVLKQLRISDFVKDTHILRDSHMKTLSQFTTLFTIEEDEPFQGLFVKYRPIYDREAATVYVDNLPEGCSEEKLLRLCSCYGTVVEVRISKKGGRWIRPKQNFKKRTSGVSTNRQAHRTPPKKKPLINVGSRPKAFGFVRFVDSDSAAAMVRDFIVNDPSIKYQKHEKRKKEAELVRRQEENEEEEIPDILSPGEIDDLEPPVVPQEFPPRLRPFVELYMTKLLREIRFLKMRRKRRPWPMYMRLRKLERRFAELKRREFACLRKSGAIQPRKRIRKNLKTQIESAFSPSTSIPSCSTGRAPPPTSPEDEAPSTSESLQNPIPYHINIERSRNKRKKKSKKEKPKKKKPPTKKEEGIEKPELVKKKKNRRRKRKKMCRKLAKYIPGGQVRRFFETIQVFSLKKYLEMKRQWQELIRLEQERMREDQAIEVPDMEF